MGERIRKDKKEERKKKDKKQRRKGYQKLSTIYFI
jgi:hypothetical protein